MKLAHLLLGSALLSAFVTPLACSSTPESDDGANAGTAGAPVAGHPATGGSGVAGSVSGSANGGAGGSTIASGGNASGGASGAMPGGAGGSPNRGAGGSSNAAGAGGKASGGTGGKASGGASSGGAGTAGAGTAGAPPADCPSTPLTGGTQHCSSNASGNVGSGYSYTIWSSGSGGCVTPYGVGAAFKATWNSSGDFLARVGLALGSSKTYDQLGALTADFAETKTGTAGGYSYVGIYGWSVSPLVEYYIIDDWYGSRPNPGTKVGTVDLDGGSYDILTHTQTNQPAITGGNATFPQFWSLRKTARQCGHISITEHFKAWTKAGMVLGKMEEAKVLVEVGGGTGSIDFTKATLVAN
jgi:hypothetical protein